MAEERTFRARVVYSKGGRLSALSHLEVTHALERMVRRAGLPFATSNGFSPHMKIAFGSALPVGVGSTCEVFDIQLTDYVAPDRVLAALQRSAPEDMMPASCSYIERSAKAASVAYPFSVYEVRLVREPSEVKVPETIEVIRKKKAKMLKVSDFLVGEPEVQGSIVRFQTQVREDGTLRADVLAKALFDPADISSITRISQSSEEI